MLGCAVEEIYEGAARADRRGCVVEGRGIAHSRPSTDRGELPHDRHPHSSDGPRYIAFRTSPTRSLGRACARASRGRIASRGRSCLVACTGTRYVRSANRRTRPSRAREAHPRARYRHHPSERARLVTWARQDDTPVARVEQSQTHAVQRRRVLGKFDVHRWSEDGASTARDGLDIRMYDLRDRGLVRQPPRPASRPHQWHSQRQSTRKPASALPELPLANGHVWESQTIAKAVCYTNCARAWRNW